MLNAVKIYDVTRSISEDLPIYPGDPVTKITRVRDTAHGDPFTLSSFSMSTHAGTHVDAPFHLFQGGATVDKIPLDILLGQATLLSLEGLTRISAQVLERSNIPANTIRLLVKTREAPTLSSESSAYLSENAARWIVERGIRLVGIDTLSVDSPDNESMSAHRVLLESNVIVLESLDLSEVAPGQYTLVCLPLKLEGGDGAPARVVLFQDNPL